jgi:hypothetical protein
MKWIIRGEDFVNLSQIDGFRLERRHCPHTKLLIYETHFYKNCEATSTFEFLSEEGMQEFMVKIEEFLSCKSPCYRHPCEMDNSVVHQEIERFISRHYINRLQELTNILRASDNDYDMTASLQTLVDDLINEYSE